MVLEVGLIDVQEGREDEFAAAYGTIKFLSVDVDDAEDVAFKYDISSMPTFVTIRDGEETDRFSGANPDRLEEKLKALA